MWFSKKIFIPLFVVCLLVGALVYSYYDRYFFVIKSAQIVFEAGPLDGALMSEVQRRAQGKIKVLEGQNIWSVSLQKVRQHILSDVWIDSVTIEREFPQKIFVKAKIKNIVFIYLDPRGRILPVTEKGQILNAIQLAQAPDVPVLRNPTIVKNPQTLAKVIALYQAIPLEGALNQRHIAEVDWSSLGGLRVELVKSDQGEILLGSGDVKVKIKRVANVLKYLESQKQKWRVIDASFSKKVLVRLRKHS